MRFDFGRELDLILCVLDSLSLFMSCRGQANRSFNQEGDIYIYIYIGHIHPSLLLLDAMEVHT